MASILVSRIEYIKDHPGGNFFTGDVLEVYADTDLMDGTTPTPVSPISTGMSVNLNGVPFPDPFPTIVFSAIDPFYVSIQFTNPQVCKSITLCVFEPSIVWPYTRYFNYFNHSSCQVNPPTCDLIVVGVPDIISASSQTDSDGQITVIATSSNPIQYKLGSNFAYDDGTGQNDNVFSGLLPGTYRIYLRDSDNCGTSVLVDVPFGFEFGERFRFEYDDKRGNKTRILIKKRSYVDASSEVCGDDVAFDVSLTGEGSENKFEPLMSVRCETKLLSITDQQFLELYTNDPNLYRTEYWKSFNGGVDYDLLLTTKQLPQLYSEQYKSPPYSINSVSTCGLPDLKNFYLIQGDGQKYYGTISLIKLVSYCLSFLRLDLNIRVGVNLYAIDMDSGDDDDPFDQANIDFECFYLAENEPSLDFVLRSILEPFGARIVQWGNIWNIVRVEEMTGSYDYREFDSNGDFIESGSYNPVKYLDFPRASGDLKFVQDSQNLELRPGYGNIVAKYILGLKPNIFKNGDFRLNSSYIPSLGIYTFSINKDGWNLVNAGYPISEGYERINNFNVAYAISADESIQDVTTGGEAYIQSDSYDVALGTNNSIKILIRCKVSRLSVQFVDTVYTIDVPYVKIRVVVQYGSQYLMNNGAWTNTYNEIIFYCTEFNKYADYEIIAKQPTSGSPSSGMYFLVRVYHAYAYHAQFQDIDDMRDFVTYDSPDIVIPTGYRTQLKDPVLDGIYEYLGYYELEETTAAENVPFIIRQDDYHATDNPRQWVLKSKSQIGGGVIGIQSYPFAIDKIEGKLLVDGNDPFDALVRNIKGETNNKLFLEKELIIGSFSEFQQTQVNFGLGDLQFNFSTGFTQSLPSIAIVTTNVLAAYLIYSGYLRDSDGNGYVDFARPGISEADKLHGIFLKSYAAQYKRSWRLLRCSFKANNYFSFLDVFREVNDSNRVYLPMGVTLNDKNCIYSGEFHELMDIYANPGSDGSGEAPYSSAFSTGFGSSGFN